MPQVIVVNFFSIFAQHGCWEVETCFGWCGNCKFQSICLVAERTFKSQGRASSLPLVVFVAWFNALSSISPEKESVMGLIQCKQEGALWLMLQLPFQLKQLLFSFSPLFLHNPTPALSPAGLEVGGVFPFCQSHWLCLVGLSLYQCKQKQGSGVWCILLSKILLLVCLWSWTPE